MVFGVLAMSVLLLGSFLVNIDRGDDGPVTGQVAARLLVVSSYPLWCNTTAYEGFNLFALHCIPTNASVKNVFVDSMANITSLHAYDGSASGDPWSAYNPDLPSWVVQDLSRIERTQGYWLRMDSKTSLNIFGTYNEPVINSLVPGWNLAAYALINVTNVNESLRGIETVLSLILGYNATDIADPWKSYNPAVAPAFNDLDLFHPFHGYWINLTDNGSWYLDI